MDAREGGSGLAAALTSTSKNELMALAVDARGRVVASYGPLLCNVIVDLSRGAANGHHILKLDSCTQESGN